MLHFCRILTYLHYSAYNKCTLFSSTLSHTVHDIITVGNAPLPHKVIIKKKYQHCGRILNFTIHPFFKPALSSGHRRGARPVPHAIGQEVRYTLDRSAVHHRA